MTQAIVWEDIWCATAAQLERYRGAGLENLLTEDVVRFAAIQQLVAAGVNPRTLDAEWRRPGVPDAVDLVVSHPSFAAIESSTPANRARATQRGRSTWVRR